MQINSYLTDSFTEYEGYNSLVIFTKECNLNCYGCYNKEILKEEPKLDFEEVLTKNINPLVQAVVFLGGEPTCNRDIFLMIRYVKEKFPELKIKVYTNGLNFKKLKEIEPLVDTFSVDFKTWYNHNNLLGIDISGQSYLHLITYVLDYLYPLGKVSEIRTVNNPKLDNNELELIKFHIENAYPKVKHIISKFIEPQC